MKVAHVKEIDASEIDADENVAVAVAVAAAMSAPVRAARWAQVGVLSLMACCLALTAWIYWPGIEGPSMLDDRSSVMVIADLKESPELAMDYVFGDRSGKLGRSVSMATFVLERLYLDGTMRSSKQVNIVLHLLIGVLVIWLLWWLFEHIAIPGHRALAVVLGASWLLHPLFVSTVLYAVQRMAMLSTLFVVLGCISYLHWRRGLIAGKSVLGAGSIVRFLLVPLCLLLALFSKENGILLIPILLLIEALWLQFEGVGGRRIRWLRGVTYVSIAAGATGLMAVLIIRYEWLAARFAKRPFTLDERLLTQSRVIWDYLAQWFWPDVSRMGIYHDDFSISQSLTQPLNTLAAIAALAVVAVVFLLLLRRRWGRYMALGIAWFFIGHSVESTVLSLEIYFEHRNYFPAIGLLLVIGVAFGWLVKRMPEPKIALLTGLGVMAFWLALNTSSQAVVWSSRPLLVLHNLNGHPYSARANIDMAEQMARLGDAKRAHRYSAEAFTHSMVERHADYMLRDVALSCIAQDIAPREQIDQIGLRDPARPLSSVTTLLAVARLADSDACPGFDWLYFADHLSQVFLVEDFQRKAAANIYSTLAVLENGLQRFEHAYEYTKRFLALSPNNKRGLLMQLQFTAVLGKNDEAKDLIEVLQKLGEQGKLTVQEQQTLALYL